MEGLICEEEASFVLGEHSSFELTIFPIGTNPSGSPYGVTIDGLDSGQIICILCGAVLTADRLQNYRKCKETLAEITRIDTAYLFLQSDRLGFCNTCSSQVDQLREKYTAFVDIKKQLVSLFTRVSLDLKRTNNQLLKGLHSFQDDDAFFKAWNHRRMQAMLMQTPESVETTGKTPMDRNLASRKRTASVLGNSIFSLQTKGKRSRINLNEKQKHHSTSTKPRDPRKGIIDGFPCEICGTSFIEYEELVVHLKTHKSPVPTSSKSIPQRKFCCDQCDKSFSRGYSLRIHQLSHEIGRREFPHCDKCNKNFTSSRTFEVHNKTHAKEKMKLNCPLCGKSLAQKRALDVHLHRHHINDYLIAAVDCNICFKTFPSPLILMNHMDVHCGEYQCQVENCKKSFKSSTLLQNHENKIHKPGKRIYYECDFCTVVFSTQNSFDEHKSLHSLESTFLCDHCGKSFPSKSLLESHLRLHKRVENRCEVCKKGFSSASNLKKHMRLHTGDRPFQCHLCDQSFFQKVSMDMHMRKHSGVKPFSCPYCLNVGFSYKLGLRQHLASQHEEVYLATKPFICNICWKNFVTEQELLQHDGSHEKHKCKLCGRQFKMLTHLKEHLLRHAALKPHKCNFCEGNAFIRKKALIDHIKSFHPDVDAESAAAETDNITYIVHIDQ